MLKIEVRKVAEGKCPKCEGIGVVIPKDGEMRPEFGSFCSECDEGKRRWQCVLESVSLVERGLEYKGVGREGSGWEIR
ncbi:MAG TPA: hypothetical protein VEZ90_17810 [Blastocatellia bacterium]|nr:hypothetical protein [Blastocatellia bacterium]